MINGSQAVKITALQWQLIIQIWQYLKNKHCNDDLPDLEGGQLKVALSRQVLSEDAYHHLTSIDVHLNHTSQWFPLMLHMARALYVLSMSGKIRERPSGYITQCQPYLGLWLLHINQRHFIHSTGRTLTSVLANFVQSTLLNCTNHPGICRSRCTGSRRGTWRAICEIILPRYKRHLVFCTETKCQ